MKVKLFMIPKEKVNNQVACVEESASLEQASKIIVEKHIGSVVVVNSLHDPVGIITKTDLVKAGFVEGLPSSTPVTQIMHKQLEFCNEEIERDQVAELLMKKSIHHLLVRNKHNEWTGLTTSMDVVTEAALDAKAFPWVRNHK
ncbi:predicted protein [Naegleria gruberi]|uniref:Predicted protein n=1 Tax=Naegleria gruberi TaxID=5762 RepID=D2V3Z6_NAEGR|nr:uncharacterized protein NAEGRDRAFT_63544 [Naegleria gruberi]EFC48435.1 predicted protein [Naegleria gruberi]|eukprot:XP_002681179.1 predicted protein [Naegleria gruberi strain NEG-M]